MDGNTEAHVIRVLSLPLLLPPAFLYSFQTRQRTSPITKQPIEEITRFTTLVPTVRADVGMPFIG